MKKTTNLKEVSDIPWQSRIRYQQNPMNRLQKHRGINRFQWKTNKILRKIMIFNEKLNSIEAFSDFRWTAQQSLRKSMISGEQLKVPQEDRWFLWTNETIPKGIYGFPNVLKGTNWIHKTPEKIRKLEQQQHTPRDYNARLGLYHLHLLFQLS